MSKASIGSSTPSSRDSIWNGKPAPSAYLHKQLDVTLRLDHLFSFRMIIDTSIECKNASSKGQATSITAVGSGRGGVESGCAGAAGLDGFLSRHAERGLGVSPLRHLSPDLLS